MAWGTVAQLMTSRGSGFILPEGKPATGKDLFFHRNDMAGREPWNVLSYDGLYEGQRVEYDLGTDERFGTPKATRVRPLAPTSMTDGGSLEVATVWCGPFQCRDAVNRRWQWSARSSHES